MSPHQLAVEIENAYDCRDRDALRRHLLQLVALAEQHRAARRAVAAALPPAPQPLDPSDPP